MYFEVYVKDLATTYLCLYTALWNIWRLSDSGWRPGFLCHLLYINSRLRSREESIKLEVIWKTYFGCHGCRKFIARVNAGLRVGRGHNARLRLYWYKGQCDIDCRYLACTHTRTCRLWPRGVMVRTLDLWLNGSRFDCLPFRFQVTTVGKLFTLHTRACVTKQYKLVPVKGRRCPTAEKITVGLASHWPRVTDFNGLSTYGLNGLRKEMSTPPTHL